MQPNKDYEYRTVEGRAVGKDLPFSVGIAKPIELNLLKEKLTYQSIYINVRTVFRAYHGAYASTARPKDSILINGFLQELSDLKAFLEAVGYAVVVYNTVHLDLNKYLKDAKLKTPRTKLQVAYADIEKLSCVHALKEGLVDKIFNLSIKGEQVDTIIMTHFPSDLLSSHHFGTLTLMETQEGTIKTRKDWSTKLGIDADLAKRMPFNILTLQVFGDKSKLFFKHDKALVNALTELAKSKRWNSLTTLTRVKSDISKLEKDKRVIFNRMINSKIP